MTSKQINLRPTFGLSLAAAFLVHVIVIAALLVLPAERRLRPDPPESVSVTIVARPDSRLAPPNPPIPSPWQDKLVYPASPALPAALPAPRSPSPVRTEMVAATRFYSAAALSEPRNAQARAALGQLSDDEKAVQVCNLEAMEQAAHRDETLSPDFVVAYATAAIRFEDDRVLADGAALRSKREWRALRYRCRVRPDRAGVVGFSFALDGAISRDRWQDISLPAGGD